MLVVTRKQGEAIVIGENIEIIISEISADKVKLAVNAPKDIRIFRKELLELKQENEQASMLSQKDAVAMLKKLL